MVRDERIEEAARALALAARAPARVFLFGSRARGEGRADSDVDLLVIEREVENGFEESIRLARVAAELRVPADVIVVSEQQVAEWGDVSGTMLRDALTEGRMLAEA